MEGGDFRVGEGFLMVPVPVASEGVRARMDLGQVVAFVWAVDEEEVDELRRR